MSLTIGNSLVTGGRVDPWVPSFSIVSDMRARSPIKLFISWSVKPKTSICMSISNSVVYGAKVALGSKSLVPFRMPVTGSN
jgi:hypothetical protein